MLPLECPLRLANRCVRPWLGPILRCSVLKCLTSASCIATVTQAVSAQSVPLVGNLTVVQADRLRFGSLIVPVQGRRTVTVNGAVIDQDIYASVLPDPVGPAMFTLTYDRGNNGRQALDIEIFVILPSSLEVVTGGVHARLTDLTTDTGAMTGPTTVVTLRNCMTRICTATLRVGGTLSISRSQGGAALTVDVPVQASILLISRSIG